jgi:hypothetical protein
LDDEPRGNVQHIAEHGITKEEATEVLDDPDFRTESRSTGSPTYLGPTSTGKYLAVVFEFVTVEKDEVKVITAFEIDHPDY